MPEQNEVKGITFPLEWNIPDDIVARYATNMIIQRAENEFIISFFEVKPPVLLGNPDEIIEQVRKIKSIRANCVAQVIIAAEKMPTFVEALQKNLSRSVIQVDDKEE